jgi:hypothetical protein
MYLCVVLLLTGCQPENKASTIPVTGGENISAPAVVHLARDNALEYVISSSRLATIPPATDWQLEGDRSPDGEYRFRSGDWLMIVRLANGNENQQIMIINQIEGLYWCGCVKPDGTMVDTSLLR